MKKFFAILAIAASLTACSDGGTAEEAKSDTTATAPAADTTAPAPVDTTAHAADTTKPAVDTTKK
ncbi:hypothetical protein D3H65_20100 [Paraflavitalea soli]|jgi:hypothetical protein|uniref:Entericidin n=1 Tax=Paraflavitalea soli TaxID=2315862 RepID=A0A3B7MS77_9BACT|nr:hypothetical protein [Paraflavitalea soli]AXY76149.1 hypothetical protein D3H65_20100 [Paraflavitalea soli]